MIITRRTILSSLPILAAAEPDVRSPALDADDDAAAIQSVADAILASGRPGTIHLGGKPRWACRSPLRIDPRYMSVDGNGSTLDWSGSPALPAAVTLAATSSAKVSPVSQFGPAVWRDLALMVPTDWPALVMAGPNTTDGFNSAGSFSNVAIRGGSSAVVIGQNSYLSTFAACSFVGSRGPSIDRTGRPNSGENISFFGCTFANAGQFLRNTGPNADFYFHSCSFDYWRQRLAYFQSGTAEFHGCHFEGRYLPGQPVFELDDAATLKFFGGDIGIQGPAPEYLFSVYANKGQVLWNGLNGAPAFTKAISSYMPGFFLADPISRWDEAILRMGAHVVANPLHGPYFSGTLTQATRLDDPIRACGQGARLTFLLQQAPAGAGPFPVTFGPAFVWADNQPPAMPTAPSSRLFVEAVYDAGSDRYFCRSSTFP